AGRRDSVRGRARRPPPPAAQEDPAVVSELFDASRWREVDLGIALTDVTYHRAVDPVSGEDLPTVRVAIDRPEVRNAFRPHTVDELERTLDHARRTSDVGCVLL